MAIRKGDQLVWTYPTSHGEDQKIVTVKSVKGDTITIIDEDGESTEAFEWELDSVGAGA